MTPKSTFENFKSQLVNDLKNDQTIYIMNYRIDCGKTSITVERSCLNVTNHDATDDAWDVDPEFVGVPTVGIAELSERGRVGA